MESLIVEYHCPEHDSLHRFRVPIHRSKRLYGPEPFRLYLRLSKGPTVTKLPLKGHEKLSMNPEKLVVLKHISLKPEASVNAAIQRVKKLVEDRMFGEHVKVRYVED